MPRADRVPRGSRASAPARSSRSAMTIVGDIYSVAERAIAQGYIASVWAMSAVVGPTLGGLFSDHLSWRWIFWVNVPLGLLAAVVLWRRFHENVRAAPTQRRSTTSARTARRRRVRAAAARPARGRHPLGRGGSRRASRSLGGAVAARSLFVAGRAPGRRPGPPAVGAPPPRPQRRDRRRASCVGRRDARAVTSYVPRLRAAGARRRRTGRRVSRVAAMTIGWPIAASTSGRIYLRWGSARLPAPRRAASSRRARRSLLAGRPGQPVWLLAAACFVLGLGLGFVVSPSVVAAQSAVDWPPARRGDRRQHVRPLGRQCGRRRDLRRDRQRRRRRPARGSGRGGRVELDKLPVAVLDPALQAVFLAVAGCASSCLCSEHC